MLHIAIREEGAQTTTRYDVTSEHRRNSLISHVVRHGQEDEKNNDSNKRKTYLHCKTRRPMVATFILCVDRTIFAVKDLLQNCHATRKYARRLPKTVTKRSERE
jgi:hypothetical protein